MTDDTLPVTVESDLTVPFDLTSVDRDQFLFALTGRVPVSVSDLAGICVQKQSAVRTQLDDRFGAAVTIDSTGFVQLTPDARRPVVTAAKPFLESGNDLLGRGTTHLDEDEYEAAADACEAASTIFHSIQKRFTTVSYDPPRLRTLFDTASERHDTAAKAAAKSTITYQVRRAVRHDTAAADRQDETPRAAANMYDRAHTAITTAIEAAVDYNETRRHDDSSALDTDPLTDRLEAVAQKRAQLGDESSSTPATGAVSRDSASNASAASSDSSSSERCETDNSDSDAVPPALRQLGADVGRITSTQLGKLAQAGYTSPADLAAATTQELTNIMLIGPAVAKRVIDCAKTYSLDATDEPSTSPPSPPDRSGSDAQSDSEPASASSAKSTVTHSPSTETSTAKTDSGETTTSSHTMPEIGAKVQGLGIGKMVSLRQAGYTSLADFADATKSDLTAVDNIGPTTAANILDALTAETAPRHDRESAPSTESGSTTDEPSSGPGAKTSASSDNASAPDQQAADLDQSAFEHSWNTIPNNERIEGQFLAKVVDVETISTDRKAAIVHLVDRLGNDVDLHVWETHGLDIGWTTGMWYVLEQARGKVWGSTDDPTKRLSSTSDLEATALGSEFDPGAGAIQSDKAVETSSPSASDGSRDPQPTTGASDVSAPTSTERQRSSTSDGDDSGEEAESDDGLLDDIMSDFDDM